MLENAIMNQDPETGDQICRASPWL